MLNIGTRTQNEEMYSLTQVMTQLTIGQVFDQPFYEPYRESLERSTLDRVDSLVEDLLTT